MINILQKIIKYLYWKLKCHMTEPFARQLVVYAIPSKYRKDKLTSIVYEMQEKNNKFMLEAIISCTFPDKEIIEYDELKCINDKKEGLNE